MDSFGGGFDDAFGANSRTSTTGPASPRSYGPPGVVPTQQGRVIQPVTKTVSSPRAGSQAPPSNATTRTAPRPFSPTRQPTGLFQRGQNTRVQNASVQSTAVVTPAPVNPVGRTVPTAQPANKPPAGPTFVSTQDYKVPAGSDDIEMGTIPAVDRHTSYHKSNVRPAILTWENVTLTVTDENPRPTESASEVPANAAKYNSSVEEQQERIDKATFGIEGADRQCRRILWKVSGSVCPGQMVAIMGASGSGKTSLLNCLYGSVRFGTMKGNVNINGVPMNSHTRRMCTFVQQEDMFIPTLTVRESLELQARLRVPNSTPEQRHRMVKEILAELGLTRATDSRIGNVGLGGISGGERRRVSFANELLTDPSLLFLDEPTSGLDSFIAESIVKLLRRLCDAGRTIVCTIHQPSSMVYRNFDLVCLLAYGRVAYFGPTGAAMAYFSQLPKSMPVPTFTNPADHFIKILAVDQYDKVGSMENILYLLNEWGSLPPVNEDEERQGREILTNPTADPDSGELLWVRNDSPALQTWQEAAAMRKDPCGWGQRVVAGLDKWRALVDRSDAKGDDFPVPNPSDAALLSSQKDCKTLAEHQEVFHQASGWVQFATIFKRNTLAAMRDPIFMNARMGQAIFLALVVGLLYFQLGNNQKSIQDKSGALFFMLVNQAFSSVFAVIQTFPLELPLFKREKKAGLYSISSYYWGKSLSDLPFQIIVPLIFGTLAYWMVGLREDFARFMVFHLILQLDSQVAFGLGYVVSCAASSVQVALALGPAIVLPFLITGGLFISIDSIPPYFRWLEHISLFRYGFEAMIINEFEGTTLTCSTSEDCSAAVYTGSAAINRLSMDEDAMWEDIAVLAGLLVAFRLLAFILLWLRVRSI